VPHRDRDLVPQRRQLRHVDPRRDAFAVQQVHEVIRRDVARRPRRERATADAAHHIYQAEIFPTALRSTAASGTYSLSRLTTAAMPFILVPLLNHTNATVLFSVVGLAMVLVAIDVAVLGPRTTGRTVEDLSD
jgi:hypothetical protein